jgi:hypothetical protein
MRLFKQKRKIQDKKEVETMVQTVPTKHTSLGMSTIREYRAVPEIFFELYSSIREAVPIIDAAISKIVRLLGDFTVECEDKDIENELEYFLSRIQVNTCSRGINEFMNAYLNQLLTYGTAIGEIILDPEMEEIRALYNADLRDVELKSNSNPLELLVCTKNKRGELEPIKYPELVLVSALNPEPGQIYGNSILRGLPFISDVLLKIYNTIGVNWERVGNVRFAITYKPSSEAGDRSYAKERAEQIATEWHKAMNDVRNPSDFVAVGDVSIKVIGADNQVLDSQIPVRQMLEQIISKLSIPPFLLGLSWSTTETMSTQQSDMLTSELDGYRRMLDPVIDKICHAWMRLKGIDADIKISWNSVSLKDELRIANTRLTLAKAREIEKRLEEE